MNQKAYLDGLRGVWSEGCEESADWQRGKARRDKKLAAGEDPESEDAPPVEKATEDADGNKIDVRQVQKKQDGKRVVVVSSRPSRAAATTVTGKQNDPKKTDRVAVLTPSMHKAVAAGAAGAAFFSITTAPQAPQPKGRSDKKTGVGASRTLRRNMFPSAGVGTT